MHVGELDRDPVESWVRWSMYCRRAGTDSDGVFNELTQNGSPRSLESVSDCWAVQFVASTREPKSAIGDGRFRCSESSDSAASESHSQLPHSARNADSSRDIFRHNRPGTAVIAPVSRSKYHAVSSSRGVW